ncbi:hypothetical protein GCM10010458_24100 [Microbacterium luteolum]
MTVRTAAARDISASVGAPWFFDPDTPAVVLAPWVPEPVEGAGGGGGGGGAELACGSCV